MDMNINFSDKKVQQITLIVLLGIVLSGLVYWFMIKDNRVELDSAIAIKAEKQQELSKILNLKPQLEQLRISVQDLRIKLDSLEAVFPDSANTPSLISSITKMARDNELGIRTFKPLGEVTQEFYVEHNYEIELVGAYHKMGIFFERLAQFELRVNVSDLNLNVNSAMNQEITEYRALELDEDYDDRVNSVIARFKICTYSSKRISGAGE